MWIPLIGNLLIFASVALNGSRRAKRAIFSSLPQKPCFPRKQLLAFCRSQCILSTSVASFLRHSFTAFNLSHLLGYHSQHLGIAHQSLLPNVGVLQTAIDSAQSHGILFVASAGNDGLDTDVTAHYPSSMNNTNVLSVGASDDTDDLWTESNYGKTTVQVTICNLKQLSCSSHFALVIVYQCLLLWSPAHLSANTVCLCGGSVEQNIVFHIICFQSSCKVQYHHSVFQLWCSAVLSLCSLNPFQSLFSQTLNHQCIYHPGPSDQLLAKWIILAQLVSWLMSAWQLVVLGKRPTYDIHGQF